MDFEQNLFISYAHIDDQPLAPGEKGWITRFHATLKAILSTRIGREAKIWRDEKLQGNDVFSDEIVVQFSRAATLVSIVTLRYLNSEWCTREAHEFCLWLVQDEQLFAALCLRTGRNLSKEVGSLHWLRHSLATKLPRQGLELADTRLGDPPSVPFPLGRLSPELSIETHRPPCISQKSRNRLEAWAFCRAFKSDAKGRLEV